VIRRLFVFFILKATFLSVLHAQTAVGSLEFVENKGQWNSQIKYKASLPDATLYLQQPGFSILLQSPADMKALREILHGNPPAHVGQPVISKNPALTSMSAPKSAAGRNSDDINGISEGQVMHAHFYQVEFLNSSEQVEIQGDKALDSYNNYFIGNDPSKWASRCKIYQAVIYKNIYPNIDLRYHTENDHLKYDLIIHPGGNPDDIRMLYRGADKLMVKSGQITVHTSVGDVKELIPHTYQFSNDANEVNKDLECVYHEEPDHSVRFHISNYSKSATIIIDPTLVFSSFTGSHSDNWGYTATYDASGNFYSGSIVLNTNDAGNGFPASTGAFQSTFNGGNSIDDGTYEYDISIFKFSSNGVNRLHATYLGGKGNEQPHSLFADGAGNLVIAGRTSSPDFPSYNSNGSKDVLKGNYDIILVKLNATGTALIGSRIIGGSENDGVKASRNRWKFIPIPSTQVFLTEPKHVVKEILPSYAKKRDDLKRMEYF